MSRCVSTTFAYAGISVLILGNLFVYEGNLQASGPNGEKCMNALEKVQAADDVGSCLFFGFCDGSATSADCGDSTLTGQTPCSTTGGESAWTDAYCSDEWASSSDNCDESTDLQNETKDTHAWSGTCILWPWGYYDDEGNLLCPCSCAGVFGAPTGDTVQIKVCT